jgi:hypothetical protein
MIITTENIQQKETININLSALFFEGFVSHSNEEVEKDDDDDDDEVVVLFLALPLLLFFFATTAATGVKNRPRMKQERKIEAKIFAICAWIDVISSSFSLSSP